MSGIMKLCLLFYLIGSGMCLDEKKAEVESKYRGTQISEVMDILGMMTEILNISNQALNTSILGFEENNKTHRFLNQELNGTVKNFENSNKKVDGFDGNFETLNSKLTQLDKTLRNITSKMNGDENQVSSQMNTTLMDTTTDLDYLIHWQLMDRISTESKEVQDVFQEYKEIDKRNWLRKKYSFAKKVMTCEKNLFGSLKNIFRSVTSVGSMFQATELLPKLLRYTKGNNNNCNALLQANPLQYLSQLLHSLIDNEIKGLEILTSVMKWYFEANTTAVTTRESMKTAIEGVTYGVLQYMRPVKERMFHYIEQFKTAMNAISPKFSPCDSITGSEKIMKSPQAYDKKPCHSDVSQNKVIVGVRLRVERGRFIMQVKEKPILPDFRVENSEIGEWKCNDYKNEPSKLGTEVNVSSIEASNTTSVVTGVRFKRETASNKINFKIEVKLSFYNPMTGKLSQEYYWKERKAKNKRTEENEIFDLSNLETFPNSPMISVDINQQNGKFVLQGHSPSYANYLKIYSF